MKPSVCIRENDQMKLNGENTIFQSDFPAIEEVLLRNFPYKDVLIQLDSLLRFLAI